MEKNLREGHRQRVKERFLAEGLEHFAPSQILEFLLFYSIPRKDTNDIAHRLMEHFGSFSAVLEASPEELCRVQGVTPNSAVLLSALPQIAQAFLLDKNDEKTPLRDSPSRISYLIPYFCSQTTEVVYLLCLDYGERPIICKKIGEGDIGRVNVDTRRIVETALNHRAASVILAHNHPRGFSLPSNEDLIATREIQRALSAVHIKLQDHIIVSGTKATSMKDYGSMDV